MKNPCTSFDASTPPWRVAQPPGAPSATGGAGLVNLGTSDTPPSEFVEIDQEAARLKRMYWSVTWAARIFGCLLGPRAYKPAMLTLTYREVDAFKPLHITNLIKCIRAWLDRRGFRLHYVWVAELQQRGALHYHVLIWLPRGLTLPKPDKQGWWPHGSTRIEWARNAVGYLCKYVSKFDSKNGLPKGARLHGAGGFDADGRDVRRWLNLPFWLKQLAGVGRRFVRVQGVGLAERETGVCVPSPWRVSLFGGRVFASRIAPPSSSPPIVSGPWSELPGPGQ